MNIVTVKIHGMEYNLKGEEREEYLHKVANYVDKKLKNILESNNKLSTASAAVLTALNSADDMFKCSIAYEELEEEINEIEKTKEELAKELEKIKEKLRVSEEDNIKLLQKLSNLQDSEELKAKEEEISRLKKELESVDTAASNHIRDKNNLKAENKELKFQLQTCKFKVIDLQNKLLENQIDLAKAKKNLNQKAQNK